MFIDELFIWVVRFRMVLDTFVGDLNMVFIKVEIIIFNICIYLVKVYKFKI